MKSKKTVYLVLAGVALLLIGIAIAMNWGTVKGWVMPSDMAATQEPINDASGRPTGKFFPRYGSASARQKSCCSIGGGFVGNCNYPISSSSSVPACGVA